MLLARGVFGHAPVTRVVTCACVSCRNVYLETSSAPDCVKWFDALKALVKTFRTNPEALMSVS
jgi:hypothetical protein